MSTTKALLEEQYLSFLSNLSLPCQLVSLVEQREHPQLKLAGWQGITTLICRDREASLWEIDIRHAWSGEIFQQNLFDHGWNQANLTTNSTDEAVSLQKIIVYLCDPAIQLKAANTIIQVPAKFVIGSYWQTIHHCYLQLPLEHPFGFPASEDKSLALATLTNLTQTLPQSLTRELPPPHPQRQGVGGLRTQGLYKQSLADLPLISVVTVVFNGEAYLEQTIQSIINSAYPNVEYIVVDGGSRDNSLAIIQKYDQYIDYWVSEPDRGIYDGMNKGTVLASGDYTLHINADDLLFDSQCLASVVREIQNQYPQQLANLFSAVLFYRLDKEQVSLKLANTPHLDPLMNIVAIPGSHQGFLGIKNDTSLFDSQHYQIVAERVMISEKIKQEPVTTSPTVVAICRSGGVSYGVNFAMLNEITRATVQSRNPLLYKVLLTEYLRLSLLWFVKIAKLIKLKLQSN